MFPPQTVFQITIVAIVIFLATGGIALINMLVNGPSKNDPYPKLTSLTPTAMFLTILGTTGVFLLVLSPRNARVGNVKLAEKQFWVGFTLMFTCYVGLELLLRLGLQ